MAHELMKLGFKNVHPLNGGYDEWVHKKGPLDRK